MSALSNTCLPPPWKKLKAIGHTIRPSTNTTTTHTPFYIFQNYMLLFFIFSFSFKQLNWYSALKKRQKQIVTMTSPQQVISTSKTEQKIIYQIYIEKRSSLGSKNGRECPLHSTIWLVDPQARNTAIGLLKATWCVPITYWTRSSFRVNVGNVAFTAP